MPILFFFTLSILIIIPVYLIVFMKQNNQVKQREEWLLSQQHSILRIDVPRNNEKAPLAAEQMFASLHGIFSEKSSFQPELSFEIIARDKYIQFFVRAPKELTDFVIGQIYAQYPSVEIFEVDEYSQGYAPDHLNFAVSEISMTKPDVYPIKLFGDFEVDPISGITSVLSNLSLNEEVWLQLVIRPIGDEWQEKGHSIIGAVRSGKKTSSSGLMQTFVDGLFNLSKMVITQALRPGSDLSEEKKVVSLPGTVEEALKAIEYKIAKLGFETKLRVLAIAADPVTAKVKCQNVTAAFKQFNSTNLNGFKIGEIAINDHAKWKEFVERSLEGKVNILNISELASLYHFPHLTVTTPNIVWSGAKKGEPPANLPTKENTDALALTVIGQTNFRNLFQEFGITIDDRRRHIYIVGKSGTGKSTLIENMAIDDVVENRGVIVVDPHGELADKVLACVPDDRVEDVIVFDPSDRSFPIAFNLLEHVDDDFKGMVASGFVGIFKKIFGDSWGPRLEHILRNTVLALLDFPESTMLDIPKMLTDNRFRDRVVEKVKDPVIKDFWVNEFAQYDSKFRTEAVSPILNKVGQFLATSTIRNIVGQPHSRIDIREAMDQQKIMVVNLSRGKIGEDNSALLGAMIITKIQLAAMSRADVTSDKRPDTFLYVDEFQNFATDSFATILSEARKYNLCLTIAHQYIDQMPEQVRSAVFGNAGTMICFRVGGNDATFLVKEFEPVFDVNDLVNLDRYSIYIKLLINGISSPAFSANTLPPVQKLTGNLEKVIEQSHKKYSTPRAVIEAQIARRGQMEGEELKAEAEAFRKGGLQALLVQKGPKPEENFNFKGAEVKTDDFIEVKNDQIVEVESKPIIVNQLPELSNVSLPAIQSKQAVAISEPAHDQLVSVSQPESIELEGEEKRKKDKSRLFRYQNIIGAKIYKEQTARGGVKWYVGEEIDLEKAKESGAGVVRSAELMADLARRAETLSRDNAKKSNQKFSKEQGKSSKKLALKQKEQAGPKAAEIITEVGESKNETIKAEPRRENNVQEMEISQTAIEPARLNSGEDNTAITEEWQEVPKIQENGFEEDNKPFSLAQINSQASKSSNAQPLDEGEEIQL